MKKKRSNLKNDKSRYEKKVITLKNSLSQGEGFIAWLSILFLAGFTPLPYKVFTIASGLIGFNI